MHSAIVKVNEAFAKRGFERKAEKELWKGLKGRKKGQVRLLTFGSALRL